MAVSWNQVQDAFPVNAKLIWLNNCGTTPTGRHVAERMQEYFEACSRGGPGSAPFSPDVVKEQLKGALSELLHAEPGEIALIHNTAEGMTMTSLGMDLAAGDEILLLEDEYPSNVYPWRLWQERGVHLKTVPMAMTPSGFLDGFREAIGPRTRVSAMSAVHWCTGMPLPLSQMAEICRERGITFVLDGSQGVGQVPIDFGKLRPCVLSFSAWKWLLGPLGLGVLVVSQDLLPSLRPVFLGPDAMADPHSYLPYQTDCLPTADRFTYSTANFSDWVYFGASLEWLRGLGFDRVQSRIHDLAEQLALGLDAIGFRSAYDRAGSPSGIVSASRPGVNCRKLAGLLGARGIVARERLGKLRLAPHVYISPDQVNATVRSVDELAAQAV